MGDAVKGGLYAEYPSVKPEDWLNSEDLKHTFDFRGVYGTHAQAVDGRLTHTTSWVGDFEQLQSVRPHPSVA